MVEPSEGVYVAMCPELDIATEWEIPRKRL
jgi:hypothetical protein